MSDVRVFQSRNSVGVRGIAMADTDSVISMAVIEHVDALRPSAAHLKRWWLNGARRRHCGRRGEIALTMRRSARRPSFDERYEFLKAHEQFVLTVTEYGYGKRSSSSTSV